jgi:enoyl-CoA hydratase/carnithine racemase
MSDDGVIIFTGSAGIGEITLDRPAAMNALSTAMAARLAAVCAELAADRGIRAIVLAAVGRAFCVGADLPLAAGLEVEDAAWRAAAFSPDRKEGIAAFVQKREPRWPGV